MEQSIFIILLQRFHAFYVLNANPLFYSFLPYLKFYGKKVAFKILYLISHACKNEWEVQNGLPNKTSFLQKDPLIKNRTWWYTIIIIYPKLLMYIRCDS